jgi:hypothetical protein
LRKERASALSLGFLVTSNISNAPHRIIGEVTIPDTGKEGMDDERGRRKHVA